jgi:selenocysteine lyase/cysteine desulfurase
MICMKRREFVRSVAGSAGGAFLLDILAREGGFSMPRWSGGELAGEEFWAFVRELFPLSHDRAYLNTGGLGASPSVVINAVKAKMDELERTGETGRDDGLWHSIKSACADLLGCEEGELAFVRNTTEGVNIVANGIPLRRGDEIITTTQEHVGNTMPWLPLMRRAGVVARFFEPSTVSQQENLDRIEKLFSKRTRLVSIPHVMTTTGLILPVKEIAALARARKAWLFVDGAQSAGMFPFNLHDIGCDAYATSGHKWLMGPKETGLLYVRKEMLDVIDTRFTGAYSAAPFDFQKGTYEFVATAQRYEYGTVSTPLRVGLGAAVGFVQRIGIARVWERDRFLSGRLYSGLREIPGVTILSPEWEEMRSAMITLAHREVPQPALLEQLSARGLRARGVTEGGLSALRISTHIYNSPAEVDRVLDAVRTVKKP